MKFLFHLHEKIKQQITKIKNLRRQEERSKIDPKREAKEYEVLVIDVKITTILKVVITILLVMALFQVFEKISDTLLVCFVSIIFAAAINPIVDWAESKKTPRSLSIIIIYILFIGFIAVMATSLIPLIIEQTSELVNFLQGFVDSVQKGGVSKIPFGKELEPLLQKFVTNIDQAQVIENLQAGAKALAERLGSVAGNALSLFFSLFGGLVQAVTVLFLTYFLSAENNVFEKFAISLIPSKYHHYFIKQGVRIQQKVGAWLRGQIILSLIIGIVTFIALSVIGVNYAFTFSMIAFLTEFIPVIGVFIAGFIAVPFAFSQGLIIGIIAIIFFFVLHLTESNIIAPLVMNKSVGVHPMVAIIALLVGWELLGAVGIILSIPVAAAINVLVKDYAEREK